jgi:hypothetical protein
MFNDGSGVDDCKRVNAGAGIDHRTRHHDYPGFDDGAWRNDRGRVDCWRQHEAKREKFLRQPLAKPTISERHDCFVDANPADFRKTLVVSHDGNAQHVRMGRVRIGYAGDGEQTRSPNDFDNDRSMSSGANNDYAIRSHVVRNPRRSG